MNETKKEVDFVFVCFKKYGKASSSAVRWPKEIINVDEKARRNKETLLLDANWVFFWVFSRVPSRVTQ